MGCHVSGRIYGEIVSQHLLPASMWVFLVHLICRNHSARFGFFPPEEIVLLKISVTMGGGEFRIFLPCHLEPELLVRF